MAFLKGNCVICGKDNRECMCRANVAPYTAIPARDRCTEDAPAQGRKDDTGKLRYDLIPPNPLAELARVYTIGANKYDDRNWEKGIKWGRIFGAMMRHAWAYWRGERDDPKDGQHHLASVAWCAFALMEYEKTHPEMDDRGKA